MFRAGALVLRLSAKKKATATSVAKKAQQSVTAAATAASPNAKVTSNKTNAGKIRYDASKAGLQQVDKEYVQRVIEECSKGSPFLKKEQQKEEERNKKIAVLLGKSKEFDTLSPEAKKKIQEQVGEMEKTIEATQQFNRRYIHIDMDMFYAAVEEKKNPNLKHIPFAVGDNNMLSTSNYIARQYGVRSGMPGFIARKLCPELKIIKTDFDSYKKEAYIIRNIAMKYDPNFVSVGLDELTMDITDYLNNFSEKNKFRISAEQICSDFREEVLLKTGLTCSGGVALTPTIAKIASNINKPNGQHVMEFKSKKELLNFVHELPLRQVPGIGIAQEQILNALNITKCGDFMTHKHRLFYLFKEKTFLHYLSIGLGLLGSTTYLSTNKKNNEVRQSIGKESSFSDPLPSKEALKRLFKSLIGPVHVQCVKEKLLAQQMKLVLKFRTYDTKQYSVSLPKPTNDLKLFLETGEKLLEPHLSGYSELRLVGVRLQKLISMEEYLKNAKEAKQIPSAEPTEATKAEKKKVAAPAGTHDSTKKAGSRVVDEFGDALHPRHDDGKHLEGNKTLKYTPPHLTNVKEKKTTVTNKKKQVKKTAKSKKK